MVFLTTLADLALGLGAALDLGLGLVAALHLGLGLDTVLDLGLGLVAVLDLGLDVVFALTTFSFSFSLAIFALTFTRASATVMGSLRFNLPKKSVAIRTNIASSELIFFLTCSQKKWITVHFFDKQILFLHMATLIYPGAGWDNCLDFFRDEGYSKFILYDTLPAIPHYRPGQQGWADTHDPDAFFEALEREFGPILSHDASRNCLTFPGNVTYFYSTNFAAVRRSRRLNVDMLGGVESVYYSDVPEGDILFRGFMNLAPPDRVIWVACNTVMAVAQPRAARVEFVCLCDNDRCVWEVNSDSESDCECERLCHAHSQCE